MARARNIKPGFFKNEQLVELPFETRLLFAGLWTMADREGRLEDRPKKIKMELFPADSVDAHSMLDDLQASGFVLRYSVDGVAYIQILQFAKHQNPHVKEQASTIPAPDMHRACTVQEQKEHEASRADSLIPDSPSLIPEISLPSEVSALPAKKTNGRKPKRSLPTGFSISDRVRRWAEEKGFDRLDAHFESFVRKCKAKDYQYADWDEGFMGAITDDWAKLQPLRVGPSSKTASALMSLEGLKNEPTRIQHRDGERPSEVAGFIPAKHASG